MSNFQIRKIINIPNFPNFEYLDTAQEYVGSEISIGMNLNKNLNKKIISKIPSIKNDKYNNPKKFLISNVKKSIKNLKVEKIYGLLFHEPKDIYLHNFKDYFSILKNAKKNGIIQKIGFSLYDPEDLNFVMENFMPDLIQVPLNLVDQRFLQNNSLKKAKLLGVEIHVRSIFLQGLLIVPPELWPEHLKIHSDEVREINNIFSSKNISIIEACFQFLQSQNVIDVAIVGVQNYREFYNIRSLLQKVETNKFSKVNWNKFSSTNDIFIDPRKWKKFIK